ncbi:hypothetical protein QQ045_011975 [Rhodiola kirilowii]
MSHKISLEPTSEVTFARQNWCLHWGEQQPKSTAKQMPLGKDGVVNERASRVSVYIKVRMVTKISMHGRSILRASSVLCIKVKYATTNQKPSYILVLYSKKRDEHSET